MKSFIKLIVLCTIIISPSYCALSNVLLNGDIMIRLMDDQIGLTTKKGGNDSTKTNDTYMNYVWNFKARLIATEILEFGFRLSNPSADAGEKISSNMIHSNKANGYRILAVPEAYFKWTPGRFSLTGGIIPVLPTTLLNFVLFEGDNFVEVGKTTWNVLMNNSQQGLLFEFLAVDKLPNASINIQLLVAPASDVVADTNTSSTENILKRDQWRLALQAPMDFLGKKISINPGLSIRTNAGRSKGGDTGTVSIAGGLTLGYKLLPDIALRAGYALGGFDKRDMRLSDSAAPFAHLLEFGTTINTKIGNLLIDGKYSNWKDRSKKESTNEMTTTTPPVPIKEVFLYKQWHGDVRFGFLIKNFTIMPRLRFWYVYNDKTDFSKLQLRPELQFKASFK